jgi:hypothetical protein
MIASTSTARIEMTTDKMILRSAFELEPLDVPGVESAVDVELGRGAAACDRVIPAAEDTANDDGEIELEDGGVDGEEMLDIAAEEGRDAELRDAEVTKELSRGLLLDVATEMVSDGLGDDDDCRVLVPAPVVRVLVINGVDEGVVDDVIAVGVALGVTEKTQDATTPSNVADIQEVCACAAAPKSRTAERVGVHLIVTTPTKGSRLADYEVIVVALGVVYM